MRVLVNLCEKDNTYCFLYSVLRVGVEGKGRVVGVEIGFVRNIFTESIIIILNKGKVTPDWIGIKVA
jgi:hypothetical protein